jgi:putative DNA-invertase from lambdoid prophage Rac
MKAAIYLRVSTEEQETANQGPDCERLCAARGWEPGWFPETASGASTDRPQWRAVLELARRGELAAVVFWSLDRIGRDRHQVVHDLEELARWRVAIVSHQESFLDLPADGPMRETLIRWWAWIAQQERQRLIERTKAGLARARAQGKQLGRPRADQGKLRAAARAVSNGQAIATAARLHGVKRGTLRDFLEAELEEAGPGPGPSSSSRAMAENGGAIEAPKAAE